MRTYKNIVGKGENAGHQHFFPFPTVYSTCQNAQFKPHLNCHLLVLLIFWRGKESKHNFLILLQVYGASAKAFQGHPVQYSSIQEFSLNSHLAKTGDELVQS